MRSEWKKCKLGEICHIKGGKRLPKGTNLITKKNLHPYIRIKNLGQEKTLELNSSYEYVEEKTQKSISKYIVNSGDIVLSIVGSIGLVGIIGRSLNNANLTENCVKLANLKEINSDFLYYYLISSKGQNEIAKGTVGAVQPKLPIKNIQNIDLDIPPLPVQKKIAGVLKSLDDKIELNRQISKNLEEQARCLFNEQFDKANDLLPDGWQIADIYSIANVIYGAPFASNLFNTEGNGKPIIRIRDLQSQNFTTYTTENHPKGYLLQRGDIVVGMDGEFRPYIWGNDEAWLNQRICVFENKRPKGKFFLYFTLLPLLNFIEETEMATTVIHIGKKDFDAFRIILPDEKTLNNYDELTMPMFEQIVANKKEIAKLTQIRDTILPKLMSGEIEV